MTTEELTFQYWRDNEGAWQWQLTSCEQSAAAAMLAGHDRTPAVAATPRVLATGRPCASEEELLAQIRLIQSAAEARVAKSSPNDRP